MMPRFYKLNGYKTNHNPQIFCELHQKLEEVSNDVYIEFCKDDAVACRVGMKAIYECGEYES
jgi:hypothetical protein